MNIGEYSIEKRTVTLVLTVVAAIGGMRAYENLGRLEDPEFTIKEAVVSTPYPGASAEDVDREVTSVLDREIQRMGQIKRLESRSLRGRSIIQVFIQDKFRKADLQQIWDELRRKVQAAQPFLPPGAGPSDVNDDFGDVYGVYVGVTGEGYSYNELKNYVNLLRRELVLVEGVKRVVLFGNQPEAIYVEMKRDRMAALGISEQQIFRSLGARNMAVDGGRARVGSLYPAVDPSGVFTSEEQFGELLISEPGAPEIIYLGNVADVKRGYVEPPSTLLRMSYRTVRRDGRLLTHDEIEALPEETDWSDPSFEIDSLLGQHAIGLAISTVEGGNVVRMGEALNRRMEELKPLLPIGIETTVIAMQSEAVTKSINGFMVNLIEAIVIVVVVLLLFMGLRAGLLIGFILFLTIAASFIVMNAQGILLERISLGALIIALGMLVDNAIVVTEGMQTRIERGDDPRGAARDVVGQNQWPLLGATFVAVIAFAAIGLSDHNTGEYTRSLFFVLLISLLMSWLTAVTVTPLLCTMLFRPQPQKAGAVGDPYAGGLFSAYRRLLELAIRARYATIAIVFALFGLSVYGFTLLPPGFFPYSTRPQYMVDIWLPQDTHIREVERSTAELERYVMSIDNTKSIANHVGSGGLRFLLVYSPEQPNPAYAQFLVNVYDYRNIQDDVAAIEAWAAVQLPDALVFGKPFKLGPGVGGNIQLRLSGPDRGVLRDLGHEASAFLKADSQVKYVRWDWKEPVPVLRPQLARAQARRNGIERPQIAERLQSSFEGRQVGLYREGTRDDEDRLLPIIYRPPLLERVDVANLNDVQIESPAANVSIPLRQVVSEFQTVFEDGLIFRRNRRPTLTLHADQTEGEASFPFERVKPRIEEWFGEKLSSGAITSEYILEWGPEYEDSIEAVAALSKSIPVFAVLMVLIVVVLFNNLRQPLVIWLTVPLALIGVTAGLLLFDQPFNFMAILGTLSLTGMLIKNAIVLVDEVNSNLGKQMEHYESIVMAGVSRLRPVSMAAATTVLGMTPLVGDIFFVSMALAVMFGLTFATVLTLLIVPTLLATVYRVPSPARS